MTTTTKNEVFDEQYPARRLLALIGDKWTPVVIYCLASGRQRFSALQRRIPGISKKMLIQVLRALERDGFVSRSLSYALGSPIERDRGRDEQRAAGDSDE